MYEYKGSNILSMRFLPEGWVEIVTEDETFKVDQFSTRITAGVCLVFIYELPEFQNIEIGDTFTPVRA